MGELDGVWRVEREAGLLPSFGLSKKIAGGQGWTRALGVPVAPFRVAEEDPHHPPPVGATTRTLVYRGWPVRDELAPRPDGSWVGRSLLLGREFCRFRMVRVTETPGSRV